MKLIWHEDFPRRKQSLIWSVKHAEIGQIKPRIRCFSTYYPPNLKFRALTLQFCHQYLRFSRVALLSNWRAPSWRVSAHLKENKNTTGQQRRHQTENKKKKKQRETKVFFLYNHDEYHSRKWNKQEAQSVKLFIIK